MLEDINNYLQYVYTGHKYAYALLVLLATTAMGVSMEAIAKLLVAKNRI